MTVFGLVDPTCEGSELGRRVTPIGWTFRRVFVSFDSFCGFSPPGVFVDWHFGADRSRMGVDNGIEWVRLHRFCSPRCPGHGPLNERNQNESRDEYQWDRGEKDREDSGIGRSAGPIGTHETKSKTKPPPCLQTPKESPSQIENRRQHQIAPPTRRVAAISQEQIAIVEPTAGKERHSQGDDEVSTCTSTREHLVQQSHTPRRGDKRQQGHPTSSDHIPGFIIGKPSRKRDENEGQGEAANLPAHREIIPVPIPLNVHPVPVMNENAKPKQANGNPSRDVPKQARIIRVCDHTGS